LHPRYKTLYFQCQKWPDSWIETSVSLLQEQWDKYYKPKSIAQPADKEVSTVTETGYFADLDHFGMPEGADKLDKYLSLPAQPSVSDPLQHWEAQRTSGSTLAHMAVDFLSIPGESLITP
ncbi:hypothetical protein K439DRAFT_1316404, partial [Ramaria rubella]